MMIASSPATATATQIKAALRGLHPAATREYTTTLLGPWTVIEEWRGIDLLALSAHKKPPTGARTKSEYPRIAYEVKVSRADLRRELLQPDKRADARGLGHEFFFAVPKDLLKPEEYAFVEPDNTTSADFARAPCPAKCCRAVEIFDKGTLAKRGLAGGDHMTSVTQTSGPPKTEICPACGGKGYAAKSLVEREWPTLWIPRDCGLIEVDEAGKCKMVRKSPVFSPRQLTAAEIGTLARWISARPDPRHRDVVQEIRDAAVSSRNYRKTLRERNSRGG
jgi:hypothetical protein